MAEVQHLKQKWGGTTNSRLSDKEVQKHITKLEEQRQSYLDKATKARDAANNLAHDFFKQHLSSNPTEAAKMKRMNDDAFKKVKGYLKKADELNAQKEKFYKANGYSQVSSSNTGIVSKNWIRNKK